MSLTELIPAVLKLPQAEKRQLYELLKAEVHAEQADSEGDQKPPIIPLKRDKTYPLWTPYNTFDAARILMNALDEHKLKHE